MGLKQKQMFIQQKAGFELELKDRMAYLAGKGIDPLKTKKDTIVKKIKARIKQMDKKLRKLGEDEKRIEDAARTKAEKAAAAKEEKEGGKAKPKKAPEAPKEKKAKGEKKPGAPKEGAAGKAPKKAEAPAEAPPAKTE